MHLSSGQNTIHFALDDLRPAFSRGDLHHTLEHLSLPSELSPLMDQVHLQPY